MSQETLKVREPPRFPFGLGAPWDGITLSDGRGNEFYTYTPQPRQWFAHNCMCDEIFYGGSMYGGKTYWGVHHHMMHCLKHGRDAIACVKILIYLVMKTDSTLYLFEVLLAECFLRRVRATWNKH